MIDRTILPEIEKSLKLKPITLITGARQVGKTTLCKYIAEKYHYNYVSLADRKEQSLAANDPEMFLSIHPYPLIIDEIQYAKGLFEAIESIVDEEKFKNGSNEGMYILTGSQIYKLMEGVTQSMAGRVCILNMSPLSMNEIIGREEIPFKVDFKRCIERSSDYKTDIKDIVGKILRGGYPELYEKTELKTSKFYSDYLDTYLTRDVSEIINLKDKGKFLKFIEITASLTGQELVLETIANAVGITKPTVESWLNVLQLGGIIHLLTPYYERSTIKRLIKRPKIYFCDTGLACYLSGIYDTDTLLKGHMLGPMAETFIVNEIMKSYSNNTESAKFCYYRDSNNNEIDLILIRDGMLSLIECKAGMTYDVSDIKAFSRIVHSDYDIGPSCIICLSEKAYPLTNGAYALPVTSI